MNFSEFNDLCESLALEISASECHGILCGLVCATRHAQAGDWLDLAIEDEMGLGQAALNQQDKQQFITLFEQTINQLQADDFSLRLLLPDDDQPLQQRTDALADWCQGFLYGAGAGHLSPEHDLPDDIREILVDFSEISRASYDETEESEEDEAAYTELAEYIRGAVMLIFTELHSPVPKTHGNHTLH